MPRKTASPKLLARERKPERKTRRERVYPNRIAELVKARGFTYATLADAVVPPTHEVTIAKLATEGQQLTHDWMKRLAVPLGVRPEEILTGAIDPKLRRVRVRGVLEAGSWSETHEWPEDEQFDVTIPDEPGLRALSLYGGVIQGESMNLRFPNGSVVVLSRVGQRPGEIAVDKRYHARLTRSDGQVEETIKTLVKDESGRFWLKPESSHPEHQEWIPLDGKPGVTVELLGRVRFVVHRED